MTTKQYFSCPKCQRPCRWDPKLAGQRVLCRRCREKIRVPSQLTADVEVHPPTQIAAKWAWNDDEDSADLDVNGDTGTYQFLDTSQTPAAPSPPTPPALESPSANQAATPFPMPSTPYPPIGPPAYPMPGNGYPAPPHYMPGPAPLAPPQPGYYPPSYAPPQYGPPSYPPNYQPPPGGYAPPPPPYSYAANAPTSPPHYPPLAQSVPLAQTAPASRPRRRATLRNAKNKGSNASTVAMVVVMGLLGAAGALALAYNVIIPFRQEQARLKALEASLQAPDFDFNAVQPTVSKTAPTERSLPAFPNLTARYPAAWPELFKRQTAAMENGLTDTIRKSILGLPAHIAESKRVQGRWSKGPVAASWTINGYKVDMTLLGPDKKLGTSDDYKLRFVVAAGKTK
ncbi:hypothetical protein [Blastopirellula marina]|uniref:Uncharacterized protein n=1 Tax=Blastopirellula marina DSM 3645 TaxID=314230 RepID=A3ZMU2_9BACT|nr:hypothetical protein [Blastopirellula marina]EAQ82268.1 hypothetical protein DSM3645_01100 [Blastopirellula marina DSM 3645]